MAYLASFRRKVPHDLRDLLKRRPELMQNLVAEGLSLFDSEGKLIASSATHTETCPRCKNDQCALPAYVAGPTQAVPCNGERRFDIEPVRIHGKLVGWLGRQAKC